MLPPAAQRRDFPSAQWADHAELREIYANMLAVLDDAMANLTATLRLTELWPETLLLFTADNGGLYLGNNYGLRGHKYDPYDGGTRAAAFLAGGFLPASVRGKSSGDKYIHIVRSQPLTCSQLLRTCASLCSWLLCAGGLVRNLLVLGGRGPGRRRGA